MDDVEMKHWKDAGHVARRALEAIKSEIVEGASWHAVIESAERFIRRHGGKPAFPTTISVNELAAHYTTDHALTAPDGWETEMVFQKGDLVKLDIGVQIHECIGDNALTVEVGNTGRHTEQIRASRESRDKPSRPCILAPHGTRSALRRRNRSSMLDSSRFATSAGTSSSPGCSMLGSAFLRTPAGRTTRGSEAPSRRIPSTPWNRSTRPEHKDSSRTSNRTTPPTSTE